MCEAGAREGTIEQTQYAAAKTVHDELATKMKVHTMKFLAKRVQRAYTKLDLRGLKRCLKEFQDGKPGSPPEHITCVSSRDGTTVFTTEEILSVMTDYASNLFSEEKIEEERAIRVQWFGTLNGRSLKWRCALLS